MRGGVDPSGVDPERRGSAGSAGSGGSGESGATVESLPVSVVSSPSSTANINLGTKRVAMFSEEPHAPPRDPDPDLVSNIATALENARETLVSLAKNPDTATASAFDKIDDTLRPFLSKREFAAAATEVNRGSKQPAFCTYPECGGKATDTCIPSHSTYHYHPDNSFESKHHMVKELSTFLNRSGTRATTAAKLPERTQERLGRDWSTGQQVVAPRIGDDV